MARRTPESSPWRWSSWWTSTRTKATNFTSVWRETMRRFAASSACSTSTSCTPSRRASTKSAARHSSTSTRCATCRTSSHRIWSKSCGTSWFRTREASQETTNPFLNRNPTSARCSIFPSLTHPASSSCSATSRWKNWFTSMWTSSPIWSTARSWPIWRRRRRRIRRSMLACQSATFRLRRTWSASRWCHPVQPLRKTTTKTMWWVNPTMTPSPTRSTRFARRKCCSTRTRSSVASSRWSSTSSSTRRSTTTRSCSALHSSP